MFEDARLIEVGDLESCDDDGVRGIRLKLRDDRIVTVRGMTKEECISIAGFYGNAVILELRVV